jgi:hypothetical protein
MTPHTQVSPAGVSGGQGGGRGSEAWVSNPGPVTEGFEANSGGLLGQFHKEKKPEATTVTSLNESFRRLEVGGY